MNDEGESSENSGSALSGSLASPTPPNEHGDEEIETHHGAAFKEQVALAAFTGDKTLAELAVQLGVYTAQITEWKRHLLERTAEVFGGTTHKPDAPDLKVLHFKIGQLTLEKDFFEDAFTKTGLLSVTR
ncbi:MAG: hypothetical protein IT391_07220 [Nitrospira sp.]|nr:hypothetical protein [Nitrospira sp.]